jgi:spore coat polysaccharide biosynthesis predicted glycosyltransferase SpsG
MIKKIAIYCDLSNSSGLGHFNRMKNLSIELEKRGSKCYFLFYSKNREYVTKYAKKIKIIFFSDKFKFKSIKNVLLKNNFEILIIDSYENNFLLEKSLVKQGHFVVSIDDHLRKYNSNIVVTNRIVKNDIYKAKPNQLLLSGSKYILSTRKNMRTKKSRNKSKKPKVLLHAGGSSSYKYIKEFTESTLHVIAKYNLEASIICSTNNAKNYIKNLLTKYKSNNKFKILPFVNDLSKKIKNYDLVAGPMGTTTFEAIMSGVFPFSVPIKDDGRDSVHTWHSLGHLAHLTNKEKKSHITIKEMWSLIIANHKNLLNLLIKNSKQLDGLGPKRLAEKINFYYKNRKKMINTKVSKNSNSIYSEKCKVSDIRYFFNARKKKNHEGIYVEKSKLNWPQHIKWWLKNDVKKFKLLSDGQVLGYYWMQINKDRNGTFATSDFYLSKNISNKKKLINTILRIKFQILKTIYKNFTWVIEIKKNKFTNLLYKSFGFYNASNNTMLRLLNNPFKRKGHTQVMEIKI